MAERDSNIALLSDFKRCHEERTNMTNSLLGPPSGGSQFVDRYAVQRHCEEQKTIKNCTRENHEFSDPDAVCKIMQATYSEGIAENCESCQLDISQTTNDHINEDGSINNQTSAALKISVFGELIVLATLMILYTMQCIQ